MTNCNAQMCFNWSDQTHDDGCLSSLRKYLGTHPTRLFKHYFKHLFLAQVTLGDEVGNEGCPQGNATCASSCMYKRRILLTTNTVVTLLQNSLFDFRIKMTSHFLNGKLCHFLVTVLW